MTDQKKTTRPRLRDIFMMVAVGFSFMAIPPSQAAEKELNIRQCTSTQLVGMGKASWYGPGFHGRKTANGEVFNMHAMTAAHKTLPLGSRVKVENEETGETLVVRINDRGPFVKGRVIDLSKEAAVRLGLDEQGVGQVVLRRCL